MLSPQTAFPRNKKLKFDIFFLAEIGHEKAQSVIDSITSSYAAEGQAHANPMLPHNQPGHGFPPPPFGFPPGGTYAVVPQELHEITTSLTLPFFFCLQVLLLRSLALLQVNSLVRIHTDTF
jgi:hypothetical protein